MYWMPNIGISYHPLLSLHSFSYIVWTQTVTFIFQVYIWYYIFNVADRETQNAYDGYSSLVCCSSQQQQKGAPCFHCLHTRQGQAMSQNIVYCIGKQFAKWWGAIGMLAIYCLFPNSFFLFFQVASSVHYWCVRFTDCT